MHKMRETTDKKHMVCPAPYGPGFSSEKADAAEHMEVWGTNFSAPGPDYCEFRLFNEKGLVIASHRAEGF